MARTSVGSAAVSNNDEQWYYKSGNSRIGPVEGSKLAAMLVSGELDPQTRVWKRGMDKWIPASASELAKHVGDQKQQPALVNFNTAAQPASKRKSRMWIWLAIGVLIVAAAVAAVFFFLNRGKKPVVAVDTPDPVEEVVTYQLKDYVVFENDECAFIIDEIGEKGDYLELDVRCVNKIPEVLMFSWGSTCINGSMFDPLWHVFVQGNSTMKSSITFPLSTLDTYNLLPAEELKFILSIYNNGQYDALRMESSEHILYHENVWDIPAASVPTGYKRIEGYDDHLFSSSVKIDGNNRPYYVSEENKIVYFDEIYNFNGERYYRDDPDESYYISFYNDSFGRPYYFNNYGATVYYDGYGFGFYDEESGKNYFYDENGNLAYYGNGGIPEYYEDTPAQELLDAGKPNDLEKAAGCHVLHKEFTIYPTDKDADKVVYPERVTSGTEQIYWEGEKGNFVVLGGEMDPFKGYIVYLYVENKSDNYVCFAWDDVVVNGVGMYIDTITVLRPHSNCYRSITIPASILTENDIETVEEIDFRVQVAGENLSIPLYPIAWDAAAIALINE